jgi:hypothetical protein
LHVSAIVAGGHALSGSAEDGALPAAPLEVEIEVAGPRLLGIDDQLEPYIGFGFLETETRRSERARADDVPASRRARLSLLVRRRAGCPVRVRMEWTVAFRLH